MKTIALSHQLRAQLKKALLAGLLHVVSLLDVVVEACPAAAASIEQVLPIKVLPRVMQNQMMSSRFQWSLAESRSLAMPNGTIPLLIQVKKFETKITEEGVEEVAKGVAANLRTNQTNVEKSQENSKVKKAPMIPRTKRPSRKIMNRQPK